MTVNGALCYDFQRRHPDSDWEESFALFVDKLLGYMNPFPRANSVLVIDQGDLDDLVPRKRAAIKEMIASKGVRLVIFPKGSDEVCEIIWNGVTEYFFKILMKACAMKCRLSSEVLEKISAYDKVEDAFQELFVMAEGELLASDPGLARPYINQFFTFEVDKARYEFFLVEHI